MNLRKSLALMLALVMLSCMIVPVSATGEHAVVLKIGSPRCTLDGQVTMVDTANAKVTPVIESGRTLLPIRMLIEHFGGTIGWNAETRQVTCSLNGRSVVLAIDSKTALVNGEEKELDVPAVVREGRTLVPVRFVSENLNLNVGWEQQNSLVIVSDQALPSGSAELLARDDVRALLAKLFGPNPVTYAQKRFSLPSGSVTANVVTVNLNDPAVRVEARHVDGTLNHTASFANICQNSGAAVIVNANFFEAYQDVKDPIGVVMSNGQFIYCDNGMPSLGFTADGRAFWGDPAVFVRVRSTANSSKTVSGYSVNTMAQSADSSVLYTPARGNSIAINVDGYALTVSGGTVTGYDPVSAGSEVNIPADGYLLFVGRSMASQSWVSLNIPSIGSRVTLEPYSYKTATEDFTDANVLPEITQLISGAPRLLRDGNYCYDTTVGFDTDPRFVGNSALARTAIGTTADGKLIIINTGGATIQQLRELMKELGCVNATNLDGGASTAMYVQGKTITTPGRELTSTLHIFVD